MLIRVDLLQREMPRWARLAARPSAFSLLVDSISQVGGRDECCTVVMFKYLGSFDSVVVG